MIRQCNRTVGCNRTPVIGLLKQPIILSPLSLIHTKFISYLTPRWTITTYFITFHFVSLSIGTVTNRPVVRVWTDLNWVQLDWMWIQNEHGHKRPNTAPIRIHFERIIGPVREWSVWKLLGQFKEWIIILYLAGIVILSIWQCLFVGPRESKWNYPVYIYEWCLRVWSRRKELANSFVFHFIFDTHQEIVNFSVNNLLCTFNTWIYSINFLPCPRPCLPFVTILTLTRAVLGSDPAAFYSTLFFLPQLLQLNNSAYLPRSRS